LGFVAEQFAFANGTRLPAKSRTSIVTVRGAVLKLVAVQSMLPPEDTKRGGVIRVAATAAPPVPSNEPMLMASAKARRSRKALVMTSPSVTMRPWSQNRQGVPARM
jgi:hypothetical protein